MANETAHRPRVGVPYRTQKEELAGERSRYDLYVEAVRCSGGEPVEISLGLHPEELKKLAQSLDAFVLPGSPADVDPSLYGASRHPRCGGSDAARERTDFALLEHAFKDGKPVLAICYGNQSLNVFCGGSLVQDIRSELQSDIRHEWSGRAQNVPEPFHTAQIEPGSSLAQLAGAQRARVNSSHHQSILEPGRDLRIVARAADGVVEAVQWIGDGNWVMGIQWHPERMTNDDPLARALFSSLLAAARKVPVRTS
jgi:putative glutamine amidotransferase